MLHHQSWKGCQKDSYLTFLLFLMVSWLLAACTDTIQKRDLEIEAFSDLKAPVFQISSSEIYANIAKMDKVGKDSLSPTGKTALYYQQKEPLLWIGRQGISPMADTLLHRLSQVGNMGFTDASFNVQEIARDMQRFKALDFDEKNSANDAFFFFVKQRNFRQKIFIALRNL